MIVIFLIFQFIFHQEAGLITKRDVELNEVQVSNYPDLDSIKVPPVPPVPSFAIELERERDSLIENRHNKLFEMVSILNKECFEKFKSPLVFQLSVNQRGDLMEYQFLHPEKEIMTIDELRMINCAKIRLSKGDFNFGRLKFLPNAMRGKGLSRMNYNLLIR